MKTKNDLIQEIRKYEKKINLKLFLRCMCVLITYAIINILISGLAIRFYTAGATAAIPSISILAATITLIINVVIFTKLFGKTKDERTILWEMKKGLSELDSE